MNPQHNAVWLYLGSEARDAEEIASLSDWCERNRVGKVIVYVKAADRFSESIKERIALLAKSCAERGIELHGMISTLQQRATERDELPFPNKECYCVDAHGISNYEEPVNGTGYMYDPRHPAVIRTVADTCVDLLRQFPGLNGIHLDFIRYYHYDSKLVIDTKSAGHWIGQPKVGQPIRLETGGVATTYFVEEARQTYNDPPIGDKLVLSRLHRFCFCDSCLAGFEGHSGIRIPAELPDTAGKAKWLLTERSAEWAEYRAQIITDLVGTIREAIRSYRADAQLSAAVWYNAPYGNELRGEPLTPGSEYECFGQKWSVWVEQGYVDFVCPMDYWMEPGSFAGVVEEQVRKADGRIPVYAGVLKTPEYEITKERYAEYVRRAEEGGASGICFFHYGSWKAMLG